MRGQGSEMEMAIRAGGQNAGLERLMYFLQVGYFSRKISDRFDWSAIERDIEKIMRMLEAKGLDPGQLARIRNYLELRLEAFNRMIRQHVERELERRAYRQGEKLTREVLADKPLFALTPDEVAQMKNVVARLARKIKDALALRQRQEQKGRLDARRTMRKSLSYGGIPMEVFLKRRHRDKPKLITICDVSDSVRNASRFMLQLVWSLQECFSRVRSFVFVSEIAEVTQAFSTYPVERAIEWALKAAPVDYHCRSDFGFAFSRFANSELESLDRKTTVMILGDARNNYNDPQSWSLRLIRERVKGVIWLNPEGQWGWGIGDSVMPMYAPSCDLVRECRTIGQLGEVVDNLVHHWWRRGLGWSNGCRWVGSCAASRSRSGACSPPPCRRGRRPTTARRSRTSRSRRSASFPWTGSRARIPANRCTPSRRKAAAASCARWPRTSASRPPVRSRAGTSPSTRCSRGPGGLASFRRRPTSASRRRTTACSPSTCSCRTRASRGPRP
jgi:uncharacterized protein with von Willebrand factor type A (vWA) domain